MLTTETKQRINTARDVLVGKVPDPKSQVEQITIAMIYKFMDDMDKEAIEFGGEPTFFAGEFDKYAWSKLFDPRLGGAEMLTLYAEAIVRMNHNPNIPQLFRDIFKNAFLPYRDPETLKLFLKTINGFAYDHSEDLGDAFEYLLQVMGSQGDAGQFRTPRHIIDFMVAVVQPQKHEAIADPACGTAGFLVSAYNYIRNQNTDKQRGDLLTPSDRQNIVKNVKGYDISPDMVRLSLVNLYLHGFTNPQVLEYDTLTSEDRWNEYFDVILANPPFMSPKGGIKPHRRFSIQSSRSEVLFLDYIAEHLRPGGRAAVIVPEGVIFQSGTAYKSLRKLLVDKYLWAVVSLPAGVFQPYSGVKTSILLLNRTLAPKTDSVLFVKVKADGYDLGAQRRTVIQNDLPNALNLLNAYRKHVMAGGTVSAAGEFVVNDDMGLVVEKERIVGTGEYYLSGERYRVSVSQNQATYEYVKIGDVVKEIKSGFACGTSDKNDSGVIHIRPMNISDKGQLVWSGTKYISEEFFANKSDFLLKKGDVLFNNTNSKELVGKTCFIDRDIRGGFSNHMTRIRVQEDKIVGQYLALVLHGYWGEGIFLAKANKWIGQAAINNRALSEIEIPLPPLPIQQQIVAEIEGYQRIIDGAQQVVGAYEPQIPFDPAWEMVALGKIGKNLDGRRRPVTKSDRSAGIYPYYGASGIVDYVESYLFDEEILLISEDGANLLSRNTPIAFSVTGKVWVNNHAHVLQFNDRATQRYLELYLNQINISDYVTGAAQPKLSQGSMNRIPIPLPPLKTQQQIVAAIERELALVNANKELITLFEQKIKDRIAAVWGQADVPEVGVAETVVRVMPYALVDGQLAMVAEEQV